MVAKFTNHDNQIEITKLTKYEKSNENHMTIRQVIDMIKCIFARLFPLNSG